MLRYNTPYWADWDLQGDGMIEDILCNILTLKNTPLGALYVDLNLHTK